MKIKILFLIITILITACSTVSKKINYENNNFKNLAAENSQMANNLIKKYEYDKAFEYLKESIRYNIMADNIEGIIQNYADMGKVKILSKKFDEGISYYNMALEILENDDERSKHKKTEAYLYNGIGEAYYLSNDFTTATNFFNKALSMEILLKNDENVANIYQNFGKIERNKENYQKSLEYLLKSLAILEKLYKDKKINDIGNLSATYYSISIHYSKLNKLDESKKYLFQAIKIDRLIENTGGLAYDYYGLGIIESKLNNKEKSLLYFKKSKSLYKVTDDLTQYSDTLDKIAQLQLELTQYKDYVSSLKELISLTKGDIKKSYIETILKIINEENFKSVLTEAEINDIKKKYSTANTK